MRRHKASRTILRSLAHWHADWISICFFASFSSDVVPWDVFSAGGHNAVWLGIATNSSKSSIPPSQTCQARLGKQNEYKRISTKKISVAGETFTAQTEWCTYCIFFGFLPVLPAITVLKYFFGRLSVVVFCGFAVFGVGASMILGSRVSSGGGLLLNALTRAHVIKLSKYLYTGSLSSSRTCNHDFFI